jgi:predicted TIM-barrel enzyme
MWIACALLVGLQPAPIALPAAHYNTTFTAWLLYVCHNTFIICNAEALVVATKETGLEVNADKTKYMAMSQDQNVGQSHGIKTDNSSFKRVEEFKYLGTTLKHQNSIQEEIRRRMKSGNACYHWVQNL